MSGSQNVLGDTDKVWARTRMDFVLSASRREILLLELLPAATGGSVVRSRCLTTNTCPTPACRAATSASGVPTSSCVTLPGAAAVSAPSCWSRARPAEPNVTRITTSTLPGAADGCAQRSRRRRFYLKMTALMLLEANFRRVNAALRTTTRTLCSSTRTCWRATGNMSGAGTYKLCADP